MPTKIKTDTSIQPKVSLPSAVKSEILFEKYYFTDNHNPTSF